MNNKKIFNVISILLGVITCCSFNKVHATESVFDNTIPTRSTAQAYTTATFSEEITLGISKNRESGNAYTWNPLTTQEAKTVWKIAEIDSNNIRDYSNLYYCLNATSGFGITNGEMAEGAQDEYKDNFDMKDSSKKNNIINYAGGKLGDNYNKVLWILDNSYIPTRKNNYQELNEYKDLMKQAGISIDSDGILNLTEDDIEVVQQMAIWYFTNSDKVDYSNSNLPSLYINGKQMSTITAQGEFGQINVGQKREEKANILYKYFIENASSTYTPSTPTLILSKANALVTETDDYYVAGPFELSKSNASVIDLKVKLNNFELSKNTYLLTSSATGTTNITNYNNLNEFYLKISKNEIDVSSTINIEVEGEYSTKILTFITDASSASTTQPVVLVEQTIKKLYPKTNINIELTEVSVEKLWNDNNNQDGIRPNSVKVQLYQNNKVYGNSITLNKSNDWEYTWNKLLDGYTYTVKELNASGNAVEDGAKYNSDYIARYEISNNKTTITNTYIPETTDVTVTKIWADNNNQDGKREEYGVTLKANGKIYGEEIKLDANTLTYTWSNIPKYANGEEIIYTVEETTIPNEYAETYSEDTFTITNTYTPGKINLKVLKVWDDQNDKDKIRPENVIVKLYKTIDNVKTEVSLQELDESNNWMHTWTGLDEKHNGTLILYSVEEIAVEKYTTTYSSTDYRNTNEITITNSYTPVVITGKYNVVLRKVDENGNILNGSKFKVSGTEYDLSTGEVIMYENQQITEENLLNGIDFMYMIEETQVPVGYNGIENTEVNIKAQVEKVDTNYKLVSANLVDSEGNNITDENISIKLEGESIVIEVKNTPIEKKFDLALRKFITKVNDIEYSREPQVDTSKLGTVVNEKTVTTATYKHSKQPIVVQKGDVITYTIRVYNEGEIDGYVDLITDYLPNNLLPIIEGVEGIDVTKYAEEIEFNSNWLWQMSPSEDNAVLTTITAKSDVETYSILTGLEDVIDTKLDAYVEGSDKLDYIDVQIKCLVAESAKNGEYLTNIAEITDSQDINGVKGDGLDSKLNNVDYSNLSDYKNSEAINSNKNSYIEGQEDDDDFEKLIVQEFDLSLRKFITKVNDVIHARVPVVDTSKLGTVSGGKVVTTATYNHSKQPVIVKTGDIVTYTIRIYNEGTLAGFANEITDDIPGGLEFLPVSDVNVKYNWKMLDKEGNETTDVSKAVIIVTDYLSDSDENNIINPVSEENGEKVLSYKDVEVQFKVIAEPKKLQDNIIINEAQISADSQRDIDSEPNRNEKYDYDFDDNEDDIDYEPIKLQYFDLALKKFITKVNNTDYNNRYPEINYNEDGSITYNHTKDPVLVTTGDIITYTIRVYNEGEIAGYATEVTDNLPEGLEFDPNNETNKLYGWKMVDGEGNETQDAEKVVGFTTDYLKDQLIDPLVIEENSKILSYKDVKIAFKVTESMMSDRVLINTAEISKDSDEDIDSIPGNNVITEDDIGNEYVKVQYFDLSLKKWVTKTEVTYNGKTTTTKTGYDEDTDKIAKVDLVASKMNKTTVKFTYNIKVTNEGELPGYAYEIKDYIPKGLEFVAKDNKEWTEVEDGIVTTDILKNSLLNPGESATVEIVLTWKNSTTNTGLKTNYAEISKDSAEDIDSVPDNFDFTEDDMDDAQVILSIKTAGATTYIGFVLITVTILAGGIFLIKRYVLK